MTGVSPFNQRDFPTLSFARHFSQKANGSLQAVNRRSDNAGSVRFPAALHDGGSG